MEMRRPTEDDWKGRIRVMHLTTNVSAPEFSDIEAIQMLLWRMIQKEFPLPDPVLSSTSLSQDKSRLLLTIF